MVGANTSALIFPKMEPSVLLPKYPWVFEALTPAPTYRHTSDSEGKITQKQFVFLQHCPRASKFFFTAELFLISVLAEGDLAQQWRGTFGSRAKPNSVSKSTAEPPA